MSTKHSVLIHSHPTSLTLEPAFWEALKDIADRRGQSVPALIAAIDDVRQTNLSSAVRVFILQTLLQEIKNQEQAQRDSVNGKNSE